MVLRHVWFLVALVLAILIGQQAVSYFPSLLDSLSQGVLPSVYVDMFGKSQLVVLSSQLAAGGVVLFLLVFAGLALFDGIGVGMARRRLREAANTDDPGAFDPQLFLKMVGKYTPFQQQTRAFVASLQEHTTAAPQSKRKKTTYLATAPAIRYFGPEATVDSVLYNWLFDLLPIAMIGVGVIGLAISAITGIAPEGPATQLADSLRPGLVGVTILAIGALVVAISKEAVVRVRRDQARRFSEDIDALYPLARETEYLSELHNVTREGSTQLSAAVDKLSDELSKTIEGKLDQWLKTSRESAKEMHEQLVSGVEEALAAPLEDLRKAVNRVAEEQSEESRAALEAVLNSFLKNLEKHFSKQMSELQATLEATNKTAATMDESFRASLARQEEQLSTELSAYSERFSETGSRFESLEGVIENLATLISPMLRQVIDNQENLLKALDDEASASRVIGRAATELSSAAQASRDTVERFITLAERLRDVQKAPARTPTAPSAVNQDLVNELRALRTSAGGDDGAGGA